MNYTLSAAWVVLLVGIAAVLLALGLAAVVVVLRLRAPVEGLGDQARSALYVFRYDNALDWLGVRTKERRSRTDELRRGIADAAADGGVRAALARLGEPKDLARDVAARSRGPLWSAGGIAAVLTGLGFQLATFVGLDVLATGVEKLAVPDASLAVSTPLLPGVVYDFTTDHAGALGTIGVNTNLLAWLIPVIVFLGVSRPWRLLTARRARHTADDSVQV